MKKYQVLLSLLTTGMVLIYSCQYEEIVQPDVPHLDTSLTIHFTDTIVPIFDQAGCLNCHGGNISPDLRPSQAYDAIVPQLVDLNDPDASKIYWVPAPASDHAQKYSASQAALVRAWIVQGAKDN